MPLFGADAVVWTRDVADLSVSDAVDVLAWMARTLVTAVLAESQVIPTSATDSPEATGEAPPWPLVTPRINPV